MTIFQFLVISRWIYFAAVFVLFGSSFFWFVMGQEGRSAVPGGLPQTFRATTILLRVAAPVAALSGTAWLAGILANMTDDFGTIIDPATLHLFFFETPFGLVAILRLALFAALIAIALLPWDNRAWFAVLPAASAMLLITQAWLGHAAEGGVTLYGALMIATYCVHMFTASAWVGGLPPLLLALIEQRAFNQQDARERTLALLLRYSMMAMVAVTLIVASGIASAGFRVAGAFGKFVHTAYGDILFAKVMVVTAMLALAYFNRFVVVPRLRTASPKGMTQITTLRTSVAFELALGVAVLGIAALLGIKPPPQ
jgi:copper resistance protein D